MIRFSNELMGWARRAGYALTPSTADGAAMFWSNPGGESCYCVRVRDGGWLRLTRSDRGGAEQFVMDASSGPVLERHLVASFGSGIRRAMGLNFLCKPLRVDNLAKGFALSEIDANGYRTLTLEGTPIAVARDEITSLIDLVPLSHYLALSLTELMASFETVGGEPLLSDGEYA